MALLFVFTKIEPFFSLFSLITTILKSFYHSIRLKQLVFQTSIKIKSKSLDFIQIFILNHTFVLHRANKVFLLLGIYTLAVPYSDGGVFFSVMPLLSVQIASISQKIYQQLVTSRARCQATLLVTCAADDRPRGCDVLAAHFPWAAFHNNLTRYQLHVSFSSG